MKHTCYQKRIISKHDRLVNEMGTIKNLMKTSPKEVTSHQVKKMQALKDQIADLRAYIESWPKERAYQNTLVYQPGIGEP